MDDIRPGLLIIGLVISRVGVEVVMEGNGRGTGLEDEGLGGIKVQFDGGRGRVGLI